jgi:CubicO group peptidase (beta-lactamase class C family)
MQLPSTHTAGIAGLLAACLLSHSPARAADEPISPGVPVVNAAAADARSTPGGTRFTLPKGWRLETRGAAVLLTPPEPDATLAIIDTDAADADAAVAAAWAAYAGSAKWPLSLASPQAPRDGWEARRRYAYETSPNERKTVFATALRAGASWTVSIVEASDATYEKRAAPFRLAQQSLRPKGYERETFAGRRAHPLDAQRIDALKAFISEGMAKLAVPGVAIGLIDGGRVVFEGGLGVKALGRPAPVDADTLFIAASNTKALTTLLLAELVDEKKLRWDQPVTEVYPAFKLGDAATTKQVQVRHLICACTGLPRQDFEWLFDARRATPASTMKLLSTMQPTSGFGEVFQYSNLMAAAAGYIGAGLVEPGAELGAAYDRAMQRKVFAPLGMNHTTFDFAKAQRGNHASPHGRDADGTTRVARMDLNYTIVPARPAGGVWTSAHDLDRYVMMELARGKRADGSVLVSEAALVARREPQVMVGEDVSYGMGLMVDTTWGVPVVSHGGDLAGYHSNMYWLPEHGVGAVILTNADAGAALRGPFLRKLVELLFDGKPEAAAQLDASAKQIAARAAKERERLTLPADAARAAALAPRYVSAELGQLTVRRNAGGLAFDTGSWRSAMASRRNDDGSTSFHTVEPTIEGIDFVVAEREGKRALIVRDAQHEYTFIETP